jgi:hypothetical protein
LVNGAPLSDSEQTWGAINLARTASSPHGQNVSANDAAREHYTWESFAMEDNMRISRLGRTAIPLLASTMFAAFPLSLGLGHEGHHVECNETAISALKADIQAMGKGEAKTSATKELEAAQQSMTKNDMDGCKSHIHNAMEATEQ